MLLPILLVALVSSLVTADTCPNKKLPCPKDKRCCFKSGKYTCCDPVEGEGDLLAGVPSANYRNASSDDEVQHAPYYDYCPDPYGQRLCCTVPSYCVAQSECCAGTRCCIRGLRCCADGLWCCNENEKCGLYYNTCKNAGGVFVPAILTIALIAFATIKSKSYFL